MKTFAYRRGWRGRTIPRPADSTSLGGPTLSNCDFSDLVQRLLESGETILGYPYEGYWLDIGRPDDYEQAVRDFEKMRSRFLLE